MLFVDLGTASDKWDVVWYLMMFLCFVVRACILEETTISHESSPAGLLVEWA